jgi:hypothetical protein
MRFALAGLSLLLAAWSAPASAQFDTGGMAARLQSGMTIKQVILTLGYRPNATISDTACRLPTGEPFVCTIWTYATELQQLQIYFRYSDPQRAWVVYSWRL